jgi:hypothetical protein
MSRRSSAPVGRLVFTLLGFGLLSIPLAGFTWEVISDLISGHLTSRRALIGLPIMVALGIVLRLAARALSRIDSSMNSETINDQ